MKPRYPWIVFALLLAIACGSEKKPGQVKELEVPAPSENQAPIADAGADRVVSVGDEVELDGSGSNDPDGDSLRFHWSFVARPEGSETTLGNAKGRFARFTADLNGIYELELEVFDDELKAKDRIQIRANGAPVADAGGDRSAVLGEPIELDGGGSSDPDGDELSFRWALLSAPAGSEAILGRRSEAKARLSPDMVGAFLLELVVSDGHLESSDRISVQVQELPGFSGSVIYVSPSGSDDDLGLEAAPLATIGEALDRMQESLAIKRIRLAPGIYDDEPFGYGLVEGVEILGPEGEDPAILRGSGPLFSLSGDARLSLHDLSLESEGVAIAANGAGTAISLNRIVCEAAICIEAGRPLQFAGGRVSVRDSSLRGAPADESLGVLAASASEVIIVDSRISGFGAGIALSAAPLLLRGSSLEENDIGLSITFNPAGLQVEVDDSTFSGGQSGVIANVSEGIILRNSTISDFGTGAELNGSSAILDGLDFSGIAGEGLVIGRGFFAGGEIVRLRRSSFSSIAGPAVVVEASDSSLDMGNQGEDGENSLSSSSVAILDDRPAGATGVISISGSDLQGMRPTARILTGPISSAEFRIVSAENKILIY